MNKPKMLQLCDELQSDIDGLRKMLVEGDNPDHTFSNYENDMRHYIGDINMNAEKLEVLR